MQSRISLKTCLIIVLLSTAVAVGLNNVLLILDIVRYSKAYREAAEMLYSPSFAGQILYVGILSPILEELIFRKILFLGLRKKIPFVWAMIISSVIFGIYHGNLIQFLYASICGFLLAYLCETCGSVIAPMLSHMSMNVVVCTLTYFDGFEWMTGSVWKAVMSIGVCAIIVLVSFMYSKKWMLQKC